MDYTDEELVLIKTAIAKGGNIWDEPTLSEIKQRIKTHYRSGIDGHCCYCRRRFKGEFKYDIDIEHVLPKSMFVEFIFEMFNLNISCKRCNMWIKKERTDFLLNVATISQKARQSSEYKLIHPNLDQYFDHMNLDINIKNEIEMVKFTPKQPKGNYTYEFFRLSEIEINILNQAQGVEDIEPKELLPGLPEEIRSNAKSLIEDL